jgi:hypothetical protein
MKVKNYTERFEVRFTKEEMKILKEIAKKLKTSDSHAVRICVHDYWERI